MTTKGVALLLSNRQTLSAPSSSFIVFETTTISLAYLLAIENGC